MPAGPRSVKLETSELDALREVVASDGVTRAARRLNVSQSAVSHRISRLEDKLGRRLLARRPGADPLTDDGRLLHDYAVRILALHDEALARLSVERLVGTVRLGLTEDRVSAHLARVAGRFSREHPDLVLSVVVEQSLVLEERLDAGTLDVAFVRAFEHDVRPDDTVLERDALVWIGPRDHEVPDSASLPFVAFDPRCFYRRWAETCRTDDERPLRVVLECPTLAGVLDAVAAGLGCALVRRGDVRGDVEIVDRGLPEPPAVVDVVRTRTRPADEAVVALVAALNPA